MIYIYSAWFEDLSVEFDDQDREWVFCIQIKASSKEKALYWGDFLVKDFSERNKNEVFKV